MYVILAFFWAHWYLSLFTQSFFNHRYSAHQMFTMSKFWEKVFFVLAWVFQGSSYLSPYTYGALHRAHHAFADKEGDPHSPKFSKNLMDMMWKTKIVYSDLWNERVPYNKRFTKDLPEWWSFDRFADSWFARILWVVIYIAFYVYVISIQGGNEYWYLYFLLPIHFVMGPFHGAIINWFAHKFGYTNFKVDDTSKNLMPLDVFMMGEGYHNNHHAHGAKPNFGYKWHELDPTYLMIIILRTLGIIKMKKQH